MLVWLVEKKVNKKINKKPQTGHMTKLWDHQYRWGHSEPGDLVETGKLRSNREKTGNKIKSIPNQEKTGITTGSVW